MRILFVAFFICAVAEGHSLAAQNVPIQIDTGTVKVIHNEAIGALLEKQLYVSQKTDGKSSGYRVQIHFGGDSKVAKELRAEFVTKYPDIPAYFTYEQPNFKVRVGDFKTKLEAQNILRTLREDYPSAFVVEDMVEMMSFK